MKNETVIWSYGFSGDQQILKCEFKSGKDHKRFLAERRLESEFLAERSLFNREDIIGEVTIYDFDQELKHQLEIRNKR